MKEKVANPVFGQVYMASRYYNSKRIVQEPFRLLHENPPNPQMMTQYKYGGEWVMDGRKASVSVLYPFAPNWVKKKVSDLGMEVAHIEKLIANLRSLQA